MYYRREAAGFFGFQLLKSLESVLVDEHPHPFAATRGKALQAWATKAHQWRGQIYSGRARYHTVEYDSFIKSQLASTKLTLGPYEVRISSRPPQNVGVPNPAYSTEWIEKKKKRPGFGQRVGCVGRHMDCWNTHL